MRHDTASWSEPFVLKFDTSKAGLPLGNDFNDKESLTADPTDASGNLVYAVWDRFVSPNENVPLPPLLLAHAFHQPVSFARTTSGAAASPSWEPAREIFDPGTQNGTISNQIVVTPGGTLVDGFYLFKVHQQKGGTFIAVIRSTDKGATWSKRAIIVSPGFPLMNGRQWIGSGSVSPLVRSDGVIEDVAVDSSNGPHRGRIYVTWQDHQDNPFGGDLILLSHSDNGGLTWSAPVKVNNTPSGVFTDQAFEPAVHVNSEGVVGVSYYDFRNDVAGDGMLTTDHWIAHSHDGGATWITDHLAGPSTCTRRLTPAGTSSATTRASTRRAARSGRCSGWRVRRGSPTPTPRTSSSTAPFECPTAAFAGDATSPASAGCASRDRASAAARAPPGVRAPRRSSVRRRRACPGPSTGRR
jgi:hypothetical protein